MKPSWIYSLLIIIASSSYGILSTIVKVAMQHGFTSAEAITSQYLFGFILAFILFVTTQRTLPRLNKSGVITLITAGVLTAITGIVYGQSLNYLPASLAVVMLFQFTWIGLFMNCIIHKRLPSRIELISLAFLVAGTILAAGILNVDLSQIAWQGWALGLSAAFSFAAFLQVNSRPVSGVTTIGRTFILSIVSLIIISIFLSPEIIWNGQITAGLWKFGLLLGLFGIILPILLFSIAAPKVGGALVSILSAMELPVAITVSVIVLKENITLLQIGGILLVLIGMSLPSYFAAKRNKQLQQNQ
ncbi:EamA family transporter [Lysinibacillus sp. 2017]|uniref:EamA family transporter n=1 Tax=unclassified Lysinibacillus TaxID=2636778 RepID=UPI000D529F4B|nr:MULTISPECIES: DMT family transporter [unclassified Lysinibacillus]AWE05992.1 EamA family transporter [Lysinibacillus sp. 2017]TGN34775.1 DMT family transporter [Lysinibacillus sp. S2017]